MPSTDLPMRQKNGSPEFDIVQTYHHLLRTDPDITMPVAAIESLVSLLSQSSATTISETMDLLQSASDRLKAAERNPISLSAGTDLFKRYLVTTLNSSRGSALGREGIAGDFSAVRYHLVSNARLFVQRAKEARRTIAAYAQNFIRDESVVMTNGGSRVVGAVLRAAAEARSNSVRFKVVYVQPSKRSETRDSEGESTIRSLRKLNVPVAVIPDSAVAYSMGKVSMVIVGAEGVVENGGCISRMGTYQIGLLAKSAGKPFYVVAESHKFVRLYPLGQYDLPVEQRVLDFTTDSVDEDPRTAIKHMSEATREDATVDDTDATPSAWSGNTPQLQDRSEYFGTVESPPRLHRASLHVPPRREGDEKQDAVDFTPPHLITALIDESGVHTPSAVSEELIKLWY